ncbi:MAG TPA: hypothetical protein VD906_07040 [Caulobacteraceae bacterium]|nr:hypothetical protein [Caulobacteraceae bacterium]
MAKTAAPNVNKNDIERWLELDALRKAKTREASDLKKEQDAIGEKLWTFIEVKGGKARSVERSGYVLAICTAKGSVAWKEEFVKLKGTEAAEEISAAAEPREYLSVEKKG